MSNSSPSYQIKVDSDENGENEDGDNDLYLSVAMTVARLTRRQALCTYDF